MARNIGGGLGLKLLDALTSTYKVVTKERQRRVIISFSDCTVTWTTPKSRYVISIERSEEKPQVLLTLTRLNHLKERKEICVRYSNSIYNALAWARRTRNECLEREFEDRTYALRRWFDFETIDSLQQEVWNNDRTGDR